MSVHSYEPAAGHRLRHDPFNAIVAPRPIGWISTVSQDGVANLAPYSFFNAFNYTPPIVGFASVGWKDSVQNASDTREFVWNLATADLAEAMNASSAEVPHDASEFALFAIDRVNADLVAPPMVASCPVSFECKVTQIVRLATVEAKPIDTWLVLGEVVKVHIASDLIEDGVYRTAAARPILRAGGAGDYFLIEESSKFVMRRPSSK